MKEAKWTKPLRSVQWWRKQTEPLAFYVCLVRCDVPFIRTREEQESWEKFRRHFPKEHKYKAAMLISSVADSMLGVRKNRKRWARDFECLLQLELPNYLDPFEKRERD